jgi:hypothetical protein
MLEASSPLRVATRRTDRRAVDLTIAVDINGQDINYPTFDVAFRTAPGTTFENRGASHSAIVGCEKAGTSRRLFVSVERDRFTAKLWTLSKLNRYRSCFSAIAFT